jgi:hypothetical protein
LTDGAKDPGGDMGANDSSVDNIDEIVEETETMLTDGAKNPGGNTGANSSLVDDMDEIEEETTLKGGCAMSMDGNEGADEGPVNNMDKFGLIFDFEDIEKICLKEFGSYAKFNNKCLHRGYKSGSVKTYLSAQLFSAPIGKRSSCKITWQNLNPQQG